MNNMKTMYMGTGEQKRESIYDIIARSIMEMDLPEEEKNQRIAKLMSTKKLHVNILLAGATGSGKSSTINAMFNTEVAEVGVGVDPETDSIECYQLDNLTIWDTPGLGDGKMEDIKYTQMIERKLDEKDANGKPLIDLVLIVLDASSKDLGTSYRLINEVIIPHMHERAHSQILIGLNQADVAMKGKHWNAERNTPDVVLQEYLQEKADFVQRRIHSTTGLFLKPVIYCAGYKEEGMEQCKPYNLTKLLYMIVKSIPADKRLLMADNFNDNEDNWEYDDHEDDYKTEVRKSFLESIGVSISEGTDAGSIFGEALLGIPGKGVGFVFGGLIGAVTGFFKAIFHG